MNAIQNRLISDFKDAEYAHAYMAAHTVETLATQVYQTRKKRGWNQEELASRSGMAQARISKIEAGDFTSLTMATLNKLAEALDVNLRVEFEPFANAVHSVCSQTKKNFELPSRSESLKDLKSSFALVNELYSCDPVRVNTSAVTPSTNVAGGGTMTIGAPITADSFKLPLQVEVQA